MAANDFNIRYTADLARLQITDEEAERYSSQLSKIIGYIETLQEVDVSGIEPTAHAAPVFDVMRDDISREGFSVEEALSNAPQKTADQFLVTKVVE